MANNIRRLRVASLLTPTQLAERMGAELSDIDRIEAEDFVLGEEWIKSAARALSVPPAAVTDPHLEMANHVLPAANKAGLRPRHCPTALRHAILALVAKLAGSRLERSLDADDVARAVQNFHGFAERWAAGGDADELTRLQRALQITVLAILQARDFAPGSNFEADLRTALPGAAELVRRFSRIGPAAP